MGRWMNEPVDEWVIGWMAWWWELDGWDELDSNINHNT